VRAREGRDNRKLDAAITVPERNAEEVVALTTALPLSTCLRTAHQCVDVHRVADALSGKRSHSRTNKEVFVAVVKDKYQRHFFWGVKLLCCFSLFVSTNVVDPPIDRQSLKCFPKGAETAPWVIPDGIWLDSLTSI